jgi:hypothetical protein
VPQCSVKAAAGESARGASCRVRVLSALVVVEEVIVDVGTDLCQGVLRSLKYAIKPN